MYDRIKSLIYHTLSVICLSIKDCKKALKYADKAIEAGDKEACLYRLKGAAYLHLGEYSKMKELVLKTIELDGNDAYDFMPNFLLFYG